MSDEVYYGVRCPRCGKLAVEASVASALRIKCARCKHIFEWKPAPALQP